MTAYLSSNCPHCNKLDGNFLVINFLTWQDVAGLVYGDLYFFSICSRCSRPVTFQARLVDDNIPLPNVGRALRDIIDRSFNISDKNKVFFLDRSFILIATWPFVQSKQSLPAHVPETIVAEFNEAQDCFMTGSLQAASMMYRRTLELATKDIAPEFKNDTLDQRIKKMRDKHMIIPALADWFLALKNAGNSTNHDEGKIPYEEAESIKEVTRMFLIYLYELPKEIERLSSYVAKKKVERKSNAVEG